jgi:leucyl/phenylalanyl-tRNA--protein transferase
MKSSPTPPEPMPSAGAWFPDPRGLPAEGLVAIGGAMTTPRLLAAYRSGIFPWTARPVTWWSPDPRAVLELDALHISRSLAKVLRRQTFQITVDGDFRAVMEGCAEGRGEGTWITSEFLEAYTRLHRHGHAHSLECRLQGRLVGGIYGVAIGGFFAAESMFHRVSNASKAALCHLVERLRQRGFALLDIQVLTPITHQMGGAEIPRHVYLDRLARAVGQCCSFP